MKLKYGERRARDAFRRGGRFSSGPGLGGNIDGLYTSNALPKRPSEERSETMAPRR
jgi:hypothetical protein